MDIWTWVDAAHRDLEESGEDQLADWVFDIPHGVCYLEFDEVEAALPAAINRARSLRLPWLEVFFRHWNLQYQVFTRHRVTDLMQEATALLEFSHRDETIECPQSICVVQDFCHCFALADGPGYVEERKRVAKEALARINPKWPCYSCISAEYAYALFDEGDFNGMARYLHEANEAMGGDRHCIRDSALHTTLETALLHGGHYSEALRVSSLPLDNEGGAGKRVALLRQITRARILMGLRRWSDAAATLPVFEAIRDVEETYHPWIQAVAEQHEGGHRNIDKTLLDQCMTMASTLAENGVGRKATEAYIICCKMAAEFADVKEQALAKATEVAKGLRSSESALAELAKLEGR